MQELEVKLNVEEWWNAESDAWHKAKEMVEKQQYQQCLDELESMVVSRVFELSKMNMSGTGYKLHQHISKALQACSQAVKGALEHYNSAAQAMRLKCPTLTWDEVVEYAFLSDFDLLQESRQDIRDCPWSLPAIQMLMNQHFKIKRAKEEIERLNIEIRHVVMHIQDEEQFLLSQEAKLSATDPLLAHQVQLYRLKHMQFNKLHMTKFDKLKTTTGFTGNLTPGIPQNKHLVTNVINVIPPASTSHQDEPYMDHADDENVDPESDKLRDHLETLLAVVF